MLPNFLGIGANRCGSTWIARNLMQHPDVFVPQKKELHFYDRHYDKTLDYYEAEFDDWAGESAVGEVTPQYFHNEKIAPLIKKHFPGINLFVSLRNPVDRAYSQYWRMVATSSVAADRTFEDVLKERDLILQVGCYYDHLLRFYEYFDRSQILVLIFEDIKTHPQAFLRDIYSFIDVDPEFESLLVAHRINASASLQDLGRSKAMWYVSRAARRVGQNMLSSRIESMNRRSLPAMKPETRKYLTEYYSSQVSMLRELIGRDLSEWN